MENHKKKRYKKLVLWLLIDLAVAIVVFTLLLYKPSRYDVPKPDLTRQKRGKVHDYLTYLSSEFYNGSQLVEPFDLVIIDEKLNDAIAQWSTGSEGVRLSAPAVFFEPGIIVLMGTAEIKGVEFVITIVLEPQIDIQGLLNLQVIKVKVGAMNITPLAKMIAKRKYSERLVTYPIDTEDLRTKIAASLLNDEPFDPIFWVEDKKVRLDKIKIELGKSTVHFIPAY